MSFIPVMCVILLISQVEMLPVNSMHPVEVQESPVTSTHLMDPVYQIDSNSIAGGVLPRIRRAALAGSFRNRCSNGMIPLWKGGPCVTCAKYMDLKDTDECS